MIIISHRGLINGPNKKIENSFTELKKNIEKYKSLIFELDIWLKNNDLFLGHDFPDKRIAIENLIPLKEKIIIHIKFIDNNSKEILEQIFYNKFHYFCHQDDAFTITSKGWPWIHPNYGLKRNSICVLPENFTDLSKLTTLQDKNLLGVCTDYPLYFL